MTDITLVPLSQDDREQFIKDNQEAFNYGALEEIDRRDDHFEEEGEIISRDTILRRSISTCWRCWRSSGVNKALDNWMRSSWLYKNAKTY